MSTKTTPAPEATVTQPTQANLIHFIKIKVEACQPAVDFKTKEPVLDKKTNQPIYEVFYLEMNEKDVGGVKLKTQEAVRIKSSIQLPPGEHLVQVALYPMLVNNKAQVFLRILSKA